MLTEPQGSLNLQTDSGRPLPLNGYRTSLFNRSTALFVKQGEQYQQAPDPFTFWRYKPPGGFKYSPIM